MIHPPTEGGGEGQSCHRRSGSSSPIRLGTRDFLGQMPVMAVIARIWRRSLKQFDVCGGSFFLFWLRPRTFGCLPRVFPRSFACADCEV